MKNKTFQELKRKNAEKRFLNLKTVQKKLMHYENENNQMKKS